MNQKEVLYKGYDKKIIKRLNNKFKKMVEQTSKYFRYVAKKIIIKDIFLANYIQGTDNEPSQLVLNNDIKIFRINLIAIVIKKEIIGSITNVVLDDGSGNIIVRFFEENKAIEKTKIGDVILIIGKVRKYNEEKYVSPEIIKTLNPLWLQVRNAEQKIHLTKKALPIELKNDEEDQKKIIEIEDLKQIEIILPTEKIIHLIKELDSGDGALIEDVIERSPLDETNKLLETMLEKGDIFQSQPGKIKVL